MWLVITLPLAYFVSAIFAISAFGANPPIWVSNALNAFTQIDASTTRHYGGSGLRLPRSWLKRWAARSVWQARRERAAFFGSRSLSRGAAARPREEQRNVVASPPRRVLLVEEAEIFLRDTARRLEELRDAVKRGDAAALARVDALQSAFKRAREALQAKLTVQ
jgi:hypothetical protein